MAWSALDNGRRSFAVGRVDSFAARLPHLFDDCQSPCSIHRQNFLFVIPVALAGVCYFPLVSGFRFGLEDGGSCCGLGAVGGGVIPVG